MTSIHGINEVSHPLLMILPIALMLLSSIAVGRITSSLRRRLEPQYTDFINGSILLCFAFIVGFTLFAIIQSEAKLFFTAFTYLLTVLSIMGGYFLIRTAVDNIRRKKLTIFQSQNMPLLFAICLLFIIIAYHGILIYQHSVFSEYDSIYIYLLISKSILLGDGLNHDFYTASDLNIRYPPFVQSLNAWIMFYFGYSSLRLFPLYFIIMASVATYFLVHSITKNSFLGLIASNLFLITPALLVVSSRFSLQLDLGFMFFLTTSFYFFVDIVRQPRPSKTSIIMFIVSLSLLPLTREIGLIISVALFFLLPAVKFTKNAKKIRVVLVIVSLLPLHMLTLYDYYSKGLTNTIAMRAITLVAATLIMYILSSLVKNQLSFTQIILNARFLFPLSLPLFFIISNMVIFGGPYPTIILTKEFGKSLALYREVFGIQNNLQLDIYDAMADLPRIDILFSSIALGSIFIFLKLIGFARMIKNLRTNPQYIVLMIILILMLVIWSYVLGSDFQNADIRHVMYFIPIIIPILVLAMYERTIIYQLYCFGIIVFAAYYFLFQNIYFLNYNGVFGGLWIEPNKGPLLTVIDLVIAFILISPIIISSIKLGKGIRFPALNHFSRYLAIGYILLLSAQAYILSHTDISLSTLEKRDQIPPAGWEQHIFEVVNYLKSAEPGNVFGLRAPAIPFLTNRTNFDLYSPQTFTTNEDILLIKNYTAFKQKIEEANIRYFVIPNEKNYYYNTTQNLASKSELLRILNTDRNFDHISTRSFEIYKYATSYNVDLIGPSQQWKTYNDAKVYSRSGNLNIIFETLKNETTYNRAVLQTRLDLKTGGPIFLFLDYATESQVGKAKFSIEIRDKADTKVLWSAPLDNTSGKLKRNSFSLPKDLIGSVVTIRLYAITDEQGVHFLTVKRAAIGNA